MRGGQRWTTACSTPAHFLYRQRPLGEGISLLEIKGSSPHCHWLYLHSHHCTISFINQSINQSINPYMYSEYENEKTTNGNICTITAEDVWGLLASKLQITGTDAFPNTSALAGSMCDQACTLQHLIRLHRFDSMAGDPKSFPTTNIRLVLVSVNIFQIWIHAPHVPWFWDVIRPGSNVT